MMTGQEKAVSVVAHRTALGTADQVQSKFSFPSPGSVKGAVLADLLAGERITHLTVWTRHGSSRAAHHILRLRQAGWPIETTTIEAPAGHGHAARIAEYHLPQDAIDAAGDAARRFIEEVRRDGVQR